jgi:hypothetical protein
MSPNDIINQDEEHDDESSYENFYDQADENESDFSDSDLDNRKSK